MLLRRVFCREGSERKIKDSFLVKIKSIAMKVIKVISMQNVIERAKTYVRERMREREIIPTSQQTIMYIIITGVVVIVVGLWNGWWLPKVDLENARWALSAQATASGAILGLIVAAMIFRWSILKNQEQELRKKIHVYFKQLAEAAGFEVTGGLHRFIIDVAYDEYRSSIGNGEGKEKKGMKEALQNLGKFWVLKRLSIGYTVAADETLSRTLKHGDVEELSRVSKLSKKSAIDMWESYFTSPTSFLLEMHSTLKYVSRMLAIHRELGQEAIQVQEISRVPVEEYRVLEKVVGLMRGDDSWLTAKEIARWRSFIRVQFYITSILLFTATILAVTILSGLGGFESLPGQEPEIIRRIVEVPIGLSILGAYNCIMLVVSILR